LPVALLVFTCGHWAFKAALFWLALHRVAQFLNEFFARYTSRAPMSAYVMLKDVDKPQPPEPDKPQDQK